MCVCGQARPFRLFEVLTRNRQSALGRTSGKKHKNNHPSANTLSTTTVRYQTVGDTNAASYTRRNKCKDSEKLVVTTTLPQKRETDSQRATSDTSLPSFLFSLSVVQNSSQIIQSHVTTSRSYSRTHTHRTLIKAHSFPSTIIQRRSSRDEQNRMNADEASRCLDISRSKLSSATCESDLVRVEMPRKRRNFHRRSEAAKIARKISERRAKGFATSSSAPGEARAKEASARRTAQETSPTKKEYVKGTTEQEKLMRDIQSKKNDYYAVLSVERTATDSEIKKAYRKLAVKIHPDKCQGTGAEEAFKIVSKAFACLSDAEKRAAYDRYGSEEGPQGMASGMRRRHAGQAHSPFGGFEDDIDPREIFNMFFGGGMPGVRFQTFGGNGFHTHGFHSHREQRARQQQRQRE